MRVVRIILAALDLITIAGALDGISTTSLRAAVLVLVAVVGAVLVFVAAVFAVALFDQRKPPYLGPEPGGGR
jgi:hypothetical protein